MVSARKRSTQVLAITLLLVAVGGLVVVGPTLAQEDDDEADEDEEEPGSQVRLVHAVPDGPAVDVYIDGERVLQEVDPGEVIDYQEVEPGNHSFVLVAAEEPGGVVLDTRVETEERGNYTVAATGQFEGGDGETEPVALLDNATEVQSEFAAVRLGHLVRGAPDVTVTLNATGGVVFEQVTFGEATQYKTIPEGEYTLDIRADGADGDVIATVDADLAGGEATSLLAVGAEDENETLQVLQQTDPTGPEELSPDIVPQPNGDEADDTDDEETAEDETDETVENETEDEPIDINETDVTEEVTEETGEAEDEADEETDDEDDEAAEDEADEEDTETATPEA
ncbi:DUF4397 domain-containing protein [Halorientalis pallida]|uniref:DUF4397 domain-containing protein n=1 Tax=Halorientalis pallida TaxID=2479928 RepID=A0A498L592_9EURY|nr:DUF4397 domain-containing protein [Halorientalis pallida]RXK51432.1 DUF4397 domain-containing protein [Halorientalis pallida]